MSLLLGEAPFLLHQPRPWEDVAEWEMIMADAAFRPLPGTAVVLMQPDLERTQGGLYLPDTRLMAHDITGRRVHYDWKENDAGTIVAVNNDPRGMIEEVRLRSEFMKADLSRKTTRTQEFPLHEFKVGDRVLVNRMHGIGFRNFYIDTPGGSQFYHPHLKVLGRAAETAQDLSYTNPYIVPLCRSMPLVHDPELGRWRPTGDYILIYRGKMPDDERSSGIILHTRNQQRDPVGVVLDIPPAIADLVDIELGDECFYQFDCQKKIPLSMEIPKDCALIPYTALGMVMGKRDPASVWAEIESSKGAKN